MGLATLGLGSSRKLEDGDLVSHAVDALKSTEDAIRSHRTNWDASHATYNNQFDFSKKAPWQSKNFLPKFKLAVQTSNAIMGQNIIRSNRFFKMDALNKESEEVEKDIEDAIDRVLDQSKFRQRSFSEATFLGHLESLICFKIFPVELEEHDRPISDDQEFKFEITPISAYDIFLDTTGRDRFLIHRVKMDLADYKALVKQGVYREGSIDEIEEDFRNEEDEVRRKSRAGLIDVPAPKWRKEVELLEYWGDIDLSDGTRQEENITFTIVNRKVVARRPTKNPYRHGKPPFVWGPMINRPGSVYGETYGERSIGIARLINEHLNVTMDSFLAAGVKGFEVNLDFVHNPSELKSGFYPGKTVKVRGVPPGVQTIREFQMGNANPQSLQLTQFLDREHSNATGVTEFVTGGISSGGQKSTATEVKAKSAQSQGLLAAVSQTIEVNVLEPAIEMIYSLILQYNPELFGPRVTQIPTNKLRFAFIAKGLSRILEQKQTLSEIFSWVGMISNTPIAQLVNWKRIGEMSVGLINQDVKDLLLPSPDQTPEPGTGQTRPDQQAEGQQAQDQQQLMQLLAQGGAQ